MSLRYSSQLSTTENPLFGDYTLSAEADTYVRNDMSIIANDNEGLNSYLIVGTGRSGEPDRMRALMRFDLSGFLGTSVDCAVLKLMVKNYHGYGVPRLNALHNIEVHRIVESGNRTPWVEGNGFLGQPNELAPMPDAQHPDPAFGVAWFGASQNSDPNANNNLSQPDIDPTAVATAEFLENLTPVGTMIEWDVTSLVNGWLSGAVPNYGITLVESSSGYGGQWEAVEFESRENEIYGYVNPSDSFNGLPGPKLVLSDNSDPNIQNYTFDLKQGIVPTSPTPFITIQSAPYLNPEYGYYEAVFKVNLNDPALANPYQKAIFTVTYDQVPTPSMITVNIGDSVTDNSGGGDSGTQSNDAEVFVGRADPGYNSRNFEIAGNDNAPSSVKYTLVENFIPNTPGTVHFTAADQFFAWDNRQGIQGNLTSPYLFALNGQPDSEGPVNYDIFAAFNRVIDGNYRNGGGVSKVTITLVDSDVTPHMGTPNNDTIKGTTNADTLIGLGGNDTYTVNNAGEVVFESPNEGTDTVKSDITYTLPNNVEKLTLNGSSNLNGTGNDLNNTLTGNTGANTLIGLGGNDAIDGKTGADNMQGGLGNDTYTVDHIGDLVTENANEGTDTVKSSINYTLGANLENLTLSGTANLNGTGNALKNKITGNTGKNILNGGIGADTLAGKAGNDIFVFQFGQSTITALDRVSDFAIGADKIDLLTQGGSATGAPAGFTRAPDSATTNINAILTNVFFDADGATAGNQTLGLNSAALVRANTSTYLIINDGTAGFQSANDLVINLTGLTGTLPALGTIPVGNFFI